MGIPFLGYELLRKHKNLILGAPAANDRRCLMFGRSKMSLSPEQIAYVVERDNIPKKFLRGWADDFLKHFGYKWVRSLDYSDFEGADYTWNLNMPIKTAFDSNEQTLPNIDLILDYGTTEHVFNPGMSFWNACTLLNDQGYFNAVLPVFGFCDHGLYQFSPSFFYALDRPEFRLEALYFVVHSTNAIPFMAWNGLSEEFREHVHGTYDGSFAANCLSLLNEKIVAWALFKKVAPMELDVFMYHTQQPIYQAYWSGDADVNARNLHKLKIYNLSPEARLIKLIDYIKSICSNSLD